MPISSSEIMQNQSVAVSLKRNRHDNSNTSDTSDGYPSKTSSPETVVADYDFGRLFGYEVFLEKEGFDDRDDLVTDRSSEGVDEYPSSPTKRNKTRSKRSESDVGIHLSSLTMNSPRHLPDAISSDNSKAVETNNEIENDATDDNEDTENNDSGTESDSDDGYDSDYSYLSASPVSVAPIVSRTVQVLVVDDSQLQRKISRVLLSGKVTNFSRLYFPPLFSHVSSSCNYDLITCSFCCGFT